MPVDAHKNFAFGHVSIAPVPADTGLSLTLVTGDALKFPTPPFNATVYPIGTRPNPTNAEIVRVTNIVGDVLTIVRQQEGTSPRTILASDEFSATITAKTLTDIEGIESGAVFPNTGFLGNLVFGDTISQIVPGATAFAIRNHANATNNMLMDDSGNVIFDGNITSNNGSLFFAATNSRIVPGTASLSLRNHANSTDNLIISDVGNATLRGSLTFVNSAVTSFLFQMNDNGGNNVVTMQPNIQATPTAAQNIVFIRGQFPATMTTNIDSYIFHVRGSGQGSQADAGQSVIRAHFLALELPYASNYTGGSLTAAGNFQTNATGTAVTPISQLKANAAVIGVAVGVTAGWNIGTWGAANSSTGANIGALGVATGIGSGGTPSANNVGVMGVAKLAGGVGIAGYFYVPTSATPPAEPTLSTSACVILDVAVTAVPMMLGIAGAVTRFTFDTHGNLSLTPSVTATGASSLSITPPAATTVTAEVLDFTVALHTMTITGGYATQRFTLFAQPTINAATGLTVVSAATVAIVGAPLVTGSAAITNAYALWSQAGNNRFDGGVILGSTLTYLTAVSQMVPGATSYNIRNNANTVNHLSITDKGQVTIYPETATTGFPGTSIGVQIGTTSNTYQTPQSVGSALVRIDGNFKNTTDGTGYWRVLSTEAHWTDNSLGTSTFAGGYFNIYHDGTGTDIQDLIGVIGRAFITSTGLSSVEMTGVRGDVNFTGAGNTTGQVVSAVVAHQGSWSAAATVPTYAGFYFGTHTMNTGGLINTDAYGALISIPTNASGNNIGVQIGQRYTMAVTPAVIVGLFVGSGGAWVKGQMGTPLSHDTGSNTNATLGLVGGDNGAHSALVALYFYRDSVAQGYIGFDSDQASIMAGHTKTRQDLVLVGSHLCVDTNGQIWAQNNIAAASMSIVPTARTSGTVGTNFTYTGAAHTGLTIGAIAEFNWNSNVVLTFATSGGGGTIATAHTYQFQRRQYASDVSTTITLGTTMRITGPPSNSANIVFGAAYALYIDSGNIGFGGTANFVLDSTTGTQIGTATTQKLGFWGKTAVVQPVASTNANTPTAGSTTAVFTNTTFDGGVGGSAWTVGGLVAALKSMGLIQV